MQVDAHEQYTNWLIRMLLEAGCLIIYLDEFEITFRDGGSYHTINLPEAE